MVRRLFEKYLRYLIIFAFYNLQKFICQDDFAQGEEFASVRVGTIIFKRFQECQILI